MLFYSVKRFPETNELVSAMLFISKFLLSPTFSFSLFRSRNPIYRVQFPISSLSCSWSGRLLCLYTSNNAETTDLNRRNVNIRLGLRCIAIPIPSVTFYTLRTHVQLEQHASNFLGGISSSVWRT